MPRLIDLAAQLDEDAARGPELLRRRDRSLGRALADGAGDAEARVVAWLERVRTGVGMSAGERVERSARILTALLVVLGALLGVATAAAREELMQRAAREGDAWVRDEIAHALAPPLSGEASST